MGVGSPTAVPVYTVTRAPAPEPDPVTTSGVPSWFASATATRTPPRLRVSPAKKFPSGVRVTAEAYAPLPVTLAIREMRYAVNRPGFRATTVTLVSMLLAEKAYPPDALAELYRQRWQVETDLAHLKTTLGMDVLKCETEAGVAKELVAFAIVYNLVRMVMLEAGRWQNGAATRISFVDALRWLASSQGQRVLNRLVSKQNRKMMACFYYVFSR